MKIKTHTEIFHNRSIRTLRNQLEGMTGVEPAFSGFAIRGLTIRATYPFTDRAHPLIPLPFEVGDSGSFHGLFDRTQEVVIIYALLQ